MIYIMSPQLFNQLCNVDGFTDHNGTNYTNHILIMVNNSIYKLTDIQKEIILKSETPGKALSKLEEFGIIYTHIYFG